MEIHLSQLSYWFSVKINSVLWLKEKRCEYIQMNSPIRCEFYKKNHKPKKKRATMNCLFSLLNLIQNTFIRVRYISQYLYVERAFVLSRHFVGQCALLNSFIIFYWIYIYKWNELVMELFGLPTLTALSLNDCNKFFEIYY